MILSQAFEIAERIRSELAPFCDRIEIAGSIRRCKPEVGDIEIVAIPTRVHHEPDLFTSVADDHVRFVAFQKFCDLVNRWPAGKGKSTGKYTQRILPEGIKLDLFMADKDNWGLIYAIRTGSAAFSHHVLANAWVRAGYHSMEGHLVKGFHKIPVREERDLFDLIGVAWQEPQKRNL
jgi:DNA polymerase/3'-5' exonuclease PolX